jgi:hypothetical protein
MTRTLIRKELRQHGLGLLAVLASAALAYLLIVGASRVKDSTETPFEAFRIFSIFIALLGAVVLNHRLVVLEYQARTQLFLEGLPVARWRMVAVKYALGLATLFLMVGLAWIFACLLAWNHQSVTPRFAAILIVRAFSVCWFAHSFFFVMGLAGRYRFAIYVLLAVGIAIVAEQKALDFGRFGPAALVDTRFAFERQIVPWQGLYETWGLSLILTVLAARLSLLREGSIAALLAEKMSHREKVFIAALLSGFLFVGATLSQKAKKAPFDLKQAATASVPGVTVKVVSGAGESDPVAANLAQSAANQLGAMKEYLGIKQLPPVFIVLRRDLDANRFERGKLSEAEGVHVRANFTAREWQEEPFLAWLIPEVLTVTSKERVKLESRRWVLDGFGLFWVGRDHCEAEMTRDQALALRSLYGADRGFAASDLNRWLSFREKVGEGVAAGVAWSGLKTLARRQGAEGCRRFLRGMLGGSEPKDFRVLLNGKTWEGHLHEQFGQTPEAFFGNWQQELATVRNSLAGQLAALPRLNGKATFISVSGDSRRARFRLAVDPPPGSEVRYSLLYERMTAFDEEVELNKLQREQDSYPKTTELELPQTYSRGQRLYWAFGMDVPALGCQVVSGFAREEVP